MGKMHELLAVESSVTGNYNRDRDETLKVFGKPELFTRLVTRKRHFDESQSHLDTEETKEITTTVKKRLDWYRGSVIDFFDLNLQKDKTNQKATADLVVDGETLATDLPATTLLMLENKLQDLRRVFEHIPTNPSGKRWIFDDAEQLWRSAEDEISFSTKKTAKPVVLYQHTKEHPAQVKEVYEDIPVAEIRRMTSTGMLSSKEKADLLTRLDKLLKAAKKARQQANETDASDAKMGESIMNFLYGNVV